jgi:DNA-binding CsgD family transcriptional regulator
MKSPQATISSAGSGNQSEQGAMPRTEAFVLVKRDGTIRCATPLASQWLQEHFGLKAEAKRLPPDLRRWLAKPEGKRGQCRPFTRENDHAQLVVSLLNEEADKTFALLLEKRAAGSPRTRLRHVRLTQRENQVAPHLTKTNRDIAKILGIGEATVKRHVENILEKLGVDNRAAAVEHLQGFR